MVGETLSHYRIIAELGAGGMGVVYKAEDLRLGRLVALKFLPPALTRDADAKRRFFHEARTASALDHANVCTIYDVEELPDGRVVLAMAYCEGETLKARLERAPMAAPEAARIALQIARGLARAHEMGIVHRDVKPANIMILTSSEAKLLDFGIARATGVSDLTKTGMIYGTPLYMAPEHAKAGAVDARSDVWSLGVVLFEMLAGRRPFAGATDYDLLRAIMETPAPELPGVPPDLARVVTHALEKHAAGRFANAGEMAQALEASTAGATAPVVQGAPAASRRRVWTAAAAVVLVAAGLGAMWMWRSSGARWARAVALPEILRLAEEDRYGEAFILATRAEAEIPGDPVLAGAWSRISRQLPVTSTPSDAAVSFRLIGGPDEWHPIGRTPLDGLRLPRGVFRWRSEKSGFEPVEMVRSTEQLGLLPGINEPMTLPARGEWPEGMVSVPVPARGLSLTLTGFDYNRVTSAEAFFIDRTEVTNAAFKAFVDAGGYAKPEYWTQPFVENGRALEWSAAVARFRDRTGRPGPAAWEGGTFPAGAASRPVAGVSWYEAAAYAAFRGKVLPTIYHWTHAARPELGTAVSSTSNFESTAPVDVGVRGLGPFGTFDMAGNVKEWVANEHEDTGRRYLLGGGWNEPDYQFIYPDSRSPFDRSDTNGFRCARYGAAAPAATLSAPVAPAARDYARERIVDDATFRLYADRYAYDRTQLDARVESTDDASPHWRRELVNVAAGYGGERMPIHLFLPKNVKPPYQIVLVFPGSGAIRTPDSSTIRDYADYIVMSGRALVYPVYKFTYERHDPKVASSWPQPTRAYRSWMQQVVIDVRRALDYTETRPDMDTGKVAYYGVSWGARLAPLSLAMDTRFKVAVMVMGGYGAAAPDPEVDPFHFVPRVRVPVLMLNGDQDFIFPLQTSQLPLFRSLGTPTGDKKHVLYPGGHEITTTYRNQVVAEVVAWLDRYLGRVQ